MRLDPLWVLRGYFDFSAGSPTPSQSIRDEVARLLSIKPGHFQIQGYPVRPAWRYVIWWREGEADYAEAQFFMGISEFPILSVGLSVEKGLEHNFDAPEKRLDRHTWGWPRLVRLSAEILRRDLAQVAAAVGRPINMRIRISPRGETILKLGNRAFSLVDGV